MSFDEATYAVIRQGCQRSAASVVPYVCDLVKPKTVIDVGGGEGWWAREFAARGCECLVLDETERPYDPVGVTFDRLDLEDPPRQGNEDFDLAVCLEVAEHLTLMAGDLLVEMLCARAPVVLWSAAIPGQGGHGHVNEQWPDYWTARFMVHGFEGHDCLRPVFWGDSRIEPWYRQNIVLYVREFSSLLGKAAIGQAGEPAALVHPDIYGWRLEERDRLNAILYPPNPHTDG